MYLGHNDRLVARSYWPSDFGDDPISRSCWHAVTHQSIGRWIRPRRWTHWPYPTARSLHWLRRNGNSNHVNGHSINSITRTAFGARHFLRSEMVAQIGQSQLLGGIDNLSALSVRLFALAFESIFPRPSFSSCRSAAIQPISRWFHSTPMIPFRLLIDGFPSPAPFWPSLASQTPSIWRSSPHKMTFWKIVDHLHFIHIRVLCYGSIWFQRFLCSIQFTAEPSSGRGVDYIFKTMFKPLYSSCFKWTCW